MNTEKFDIIIVRGAPAIGKSSLGRRLRKEFTKGVVVEVDTVRAMINSVKWVQKEEHMNALRATEKLCKSYYGDGYKPIIAIDTFNPSKLDYFVDLFKGKNIIVVSLYANNTTLKYRLDNREKGFKDWEMTKILNDEVGKYRHPKEIMLDTSELDKEKVLKSFLKIIDETEF